jgi:hypothetical protein
VKKIVIKHKFKGVGVVPISMVGPPYCRHSQLIHCMFPPNASNVMVEIIAQ